ncbi:MAG: MBL fold metallo-hydrolase [Firmicutes bacterium]|nr:MBL fold metallo-hydrolase [Bacillota bacterium]
MDDFIKIMGTAGARFVVKQQLRSSAGTWCRFGGTNFLIDPGPGTLVNCFASTPKLDPDLLDGILLSHRHLDHSTDLNIMVEAMTNGTYNRRGAVFLPASAVDFEPVLFSYLQAAVERMVILEEGGRYEFCNIKFSTPVTHLHPVENYGFKFELPYGKISFITDTAYFPELIDHYRADMLIINVVLYEPVQARHIQHLDLVRVRELIRNIRPAVAVLTHFGTTMLANNPDRLAENLTEEIGVKVIAASDGICINPRHYLQS